MRKAWLGALVLVAGITLESMAQVVDPKMKDGDGLGTAGKPNPAYNSGNGKTGSGKMKTGMSRSGNSNMQTGTTKTGQPLNDPNVQTGAGKSASTNDPKVTNKKSNRGFDAGRASRGGVSDRQNEAMGKGGAAAGQSNTSAAGQSDRYNTAKGSTSGPVGPGGTRSDKSGNKKPGANQ